LTSTKIIYLNFSNSLLSIFGPIDCADIILEALSGDYHLSRRIVPFADSFIASASDEVRARGVGSTSEDFSRKVAGEQQLELVRKRSFFE
jgi:hypothetical protein